VRCLRRVNVNGSRSEGREGGCELLPDVAGLPDAGKNDRSGDGEEFNRPAEVIVQAVAEGDDSRDFLIDYFLPGNDPIRPITRPLNPGTI